MVLIVPHVDFPLLLPIAALLPLCLLPAAWIMTGAALGLFLLKAAGGNAEGEWLLFAIFVPVWVTEFSDWD
jgi:hypothetical protein